MALSYVTVAGLKTRLGITNTTDDALLQTLVNEVNGFVESYCGRAVGPIGTGSTFTFHHQPDDAYDSGRIFPVPWGIASTTSLEVAPYTGATFVTVPATDFYLMPAPQDRTPGWPATEIHMSDVPSASTSQPYFGVGYNTVRIAGNHGWDAIPTEVSEVANNLALMLWRSKAAGVSDTFVIGPEGDRSMERSLSDKDRHTLNRYRRREVVIP